MATSDDRTQVWRQEGMVRQNQMSEPVVKILSKGCGKQRTGQERRTGVGQGQDPDGDISSGNCCVFHFVLPWIVVWCSMQISPISMQPFLCEEHVCELHVTFLCYKYFHWNKWEAYYTNFYVYFDAKYWLECSLKLHSVNLPIWGPGGWLNSSHLCSMNPLTFYIIN